MRRRGAEFGPLDAGLLADPLAFLSAEHARQRALLRHLERVARAPGAPGTVALARALAGWLGGELPRHLAAEAHCLHPRLAPADRASALARLDRLLQAAREDREAVLAGLRLVAAHHPPLPGFGAAVLRFAEALRRLLAFEESDILPIARQALAPDDLAEVGAEIARRTVGIDLLQRSKPD
ncbi:hemerythrin domain-containing protein [Neoroseomonas oryzicola]|uniref:Hemerythrin domain-containing protein n=1 Tax=Neoroseomonas oryzicola TaxID=535904 RepID=A0A9X9WNR9_9PROT|nr:hemerythrin domain-containing protein [Neoroseomonas oryzicola]MBR0661979.1 hemerythrin domain-containing protein [Neoroseomonas oryzicola]NKE17970.1 hemerythrin domain-containing protein [Neoroseomonas oryzicola]